MLPYENQIIAVKPKSKGQWRILVVQFAVLLILTIIFTMFDWDRRVAERFYRVSQEWFLDKQPLWVWLHKYGTIPGIVLTLAALMTWGGSFYFRSLMPWRRPCLVVVLTTLLAAGLLVNAILKQYWGRPRPSQTIAFGGKWEYRPIFPPGTPGKGASFPCGHCTMGFVFLAMAAFRRQSKVLTYGGLIVGGVLGGLLSAARIVQGAHFLSDTIWSLGIVGMVITALMIYMPHPSRARRKTITRKRRKWITILTIVASLIIAIGFMTRRPFYKTMYHTLTLPTSVKTIHINLNADPEHIVVEYKKQTNGRLKVDAHGFGWMEFDYQMGFATRFDETMANIILHINARSYFAELDHRLTLILPQHFKNQVKVLLNHQPV